MNYIFKSMFGKLGEKSKQKGSRSFSMSSQLNYGDENKRKHPENDGAHQL